MCDPISIGLTLAGTAMSYVGKQQQAGAMKRDIATVGKSYEDERGRQAGFQQENAGTVSNTLDTYSRPNTDKLQANATAARQKDYVAPLQSKSFMADAPQDFDPNSAVMSRNQQTGASRKALSISEALAKGKLDAYGDAATSQNITAGDNANKIATVDRIASGSQGAEAVQQGTLQSKLNADKYAGSTWSGLGDLFSAAGSLYTMGKGGGLFGVNYSGNGNGEF